MIELSKISKIYNQGRRNEFVALQDIELVLKPEKATVLKGPSGAGKTTLLSIIGCVSRPTAGRIWLDGTETTSLPERFAAEFRRHTFGFIYQNHNLIPGLTVLENTMLPAYPTGRKHREVKAGALELLDVLGIRDKAGQPVQTLSGGEHQRTAIARALINDPKVIVADEPTAHLDTHRVNDLMTILDGLKQKGKTLLISSHDPLVCDAPMVDCLVHMRDGRVVEMESSS